MQFHRHLLRECSRNEYPSTRSQDWTAQGDPQAEKAEDQRGQEPDENVGSKSQAKKEEMMAKSSNFGGKKAAPFAKGGGRKKTSTKTAKGKKKR